MIGYSAEEIRVKVQEIADGMDKKAEQAKQLEASIIFDRGRLEELKNLHNLIVAAETEEQQAGDEAV